MRNYMKTKGNQKSAPRRSLLLPPVSIGRQPGVYVPPPVEKPRTLEERVQDIKSREIVKNWGGGEAIPIPIPVPVTTQPTIAEYISEAEARLRASAQEEVQRTQDYHQRFIATNPSAQMVRNFIFSFTILGGLRWQSEYEDHDKDTGEIFTIPAHWEDHGIGHNYELDEIGSDCDIFERGEYAERRYVSESIFREAHYGADGCSGGERRRTWLELMCSL